MGKDLSPPVFKQIIDAKTASNITRHCFVSPYIIDLFGSWTKYYKQRGKDSAETDTKIESFFRVGGMKWHVRM